MHLQYKIHEMQNVETKHRQGKGEDKEPRN